MHIVTSGLPGVYAYLDDLVVVGDTWVQHIGRLRELFNCLEEFNFTVNLPKSEYGHATLIFLGHVIGQGKIAPIDAKVADILNLPAPHNRKALRRFLGMVGFYRRFCKNFARVVTPMTDLVSPKRKFVWTDECQTAFEKVRGLLATAPVLQLPDFKKQFVIQ
ncbi:uncharacterized mitochondrial protein AtMg00860-like [Homarus americanus]|uniref:uncharacterized mitochondrial protein AtMg00860-like n=1 Tax=Homarus americanus TaxID=6706 RepID=UPI001C47187D|nr:uncharacterized mitochondrial protein AtMg00860-like [Homarus americanus]